MADQIDLVVTLRKTVQNIQEARTLYELVQTRFQDHPTVTVTGHVTTHYDLQEAPPP